MTATQTRHAGTRHGARPHLVATSGSTERPGASPRRAFFFLLPNLADDSELDVYAFRLLAHYQRVAGLDGTCVEPTAATAEHCRMSPRRVVQARAALVTAGWITLTYAGPAGQQVPVVSMLDRMGDNLARYGRSPVLVSVPTGETAGSADPGETPAPGAALPRTSTRPPLHLVQSAPAPAGRTPDKTPEDTGPPPLTPQAASEGQQHGGGGEPSETACWSARASGTAEEPASALVLAFYRGLGTSPSTATAAMQRRDLAIARQLVAAGATPAEAEAYAVETSALEGRLAPVDLRSFERERAGWLVRHRRHERRHTDRTGLPPAWLEGTAGPPRAAPAPHYVGRAPDPPRPVASPGATVGVTHRSALAGAVLGRVLRDALGAGGA